MPAALLRFPEPAEAEAYDPVAAARRLALDFIAALDAGKLTPRCLALMFVNDEGRLVPELWQTGSSHAEQIAFLELAKRMVIEDWRDT